MTDFRRTFEGLHTFTSTVRIECEHANGWYVTVPFWIFRKRVYVCSDCGKAIDPKKMRDAADR
jgi:hypothetical protein